MFVCVWHSLLRISEIKSEIAATLAENDKQSLPRGYSLIQRVSKADPNDPLQGACDA